jgi:protein-tyrosine phosphatase
MRSRILLDCSRGKLNLSCLLCLIYYGTFDRAKAFIDNALASGGRVLVHCNGGISLSPSFVIMYVMERFQLAWDDALQMVQNKRYCISPNNGFITQIKVRFTPHFSPFLTHIY